MSLLRAAGEEHAESYFVAFTFPDFCKKPRILKWMADVTFEECLAGLTKIEELSLDGNRISDACIDSLAGLETLQHLSLKRTSISDAGLAKLRQALPTCTIDR